MLVFQRMSEQLPLQIPLGSVSFGDLQRLSPISRNYGFDRGTPVDRYYIEGFLARNAVCVHGHVLEVANNHYTKRFGAVRVHRSDVLSLKASDRNATIVGDVAQHGTLPERTFDCIIFTQVLQYVYEPRTAVEMLYRSLKPDGVLLATVPGLTPLDVEAWYWTFTLPGLYRLLEDSFGPNTVVGEAHGNVFAATAFLHGLAVEELDVAELDFNDPHYPVTVAARAIKRATS